VLEEVVTILMGAAIKPAFSVLPVDYAKVKVYQVLAAKSVAGETWWMAPEVVHETVIAVVP